jgi:hypothetical protein
MGKSSTQIGHNVCVGLVMSGRARPNVGYNVSYNRPIGLSQTNNCYIIMFNVKNTVSFSSDFVGVG